MRTEFEYEVLKLDVMMSPEDIKEIIDNYAKDGFKLISLVPNYKYLYKEDVEGNSLNFLSECLMIILEKSYAFDA
jgi:hypothetical protein